MKRLFFAAGMFAAVAMAAVCLSGCGGSGSSVPAEASEIVLNSIENNDFYIDIEKIKPEKNPVTSAEGSCTISIKDDILSCRLPYIGELRYSFSKKDAVALNAENVSITPKVTVRPPYKKYYALLEFTVRNKVSTEVLYFKIAVYHDGSAVVKVESQFRDPITYGGWLEERPV
ncbi:MAG: DUF4251 domain-containing protein [Bacteroidales bacterium]|nr:DUF4251 domain-containing protein [Bacteroidales bacterium]